ncbi:hypothetical protein Gpo141_00012418 [Globisporangium polare]
MKKPPPQLTATPVVVSYALAPLDQTDAIDENLLLAETEELLAALDATAFIASPVSTEDDEEEGDADDESETLSVTPTSSDAGVEAAVTPPAAPPTTKSGTLTTASGAKKRIRSRDRTKDELIELRRSVVEMEQHLVALRRNTTVMGKGRAVMTKTWESIAKRQLHDRQRAEAENQHLKAMLLGQLSLGGRFDQISNKRQLTAVPNLPESQTKRARVGSDHSEGMEAIIGDLDKLYGEMDSVFKATGLDEWCHETKSYAQTKFELDGDTGEKQSFIELVDMRMIPFNVQAVGNYLWESMKIWHHKNNAYAYACQDRPEDTFAVSYRVTAANGDEDKYSASFKLVKRRYIRENELVVIWKSRSDGENELSGHYTDEVGWVVVSHESPVDDTTPPTTSLRACLHIYPRKAATAPATAAVDLAVSITDTTSETSRAMRLTNLVVGSFEDDVNSINQTMENLLLGEARSLERPVNESATGLAKTSRIQFGSNA